MRAGKCVAVSGCKCKYGTFLSVRMPVASRVRLFRNGSNTHRADNLHRKGERSTLSYLFIHLFIQFEITFSYLMIAVVFNGWKFVQKWRWCEVCSRTKRKKRKKRERVSVYFSEVIMALNCPLLFAVISLILNSMEFCLLILRESITLNQPI